MRQRFNDFLHLDENGLVHFPPEWTEEAKENWLANLRKPKEFPVPRGGALQGEGHLPGGR